MPVTRTRVDNLEPPAYRVTGTNAGESYTTQEGDLQVQMRGGNDVVRVDGFWVNPDQNTFNIGVDGGAGNDRILNGINYAYGGPGNDYIELRHTAVGGIGDGGPGDDYLEIIDGWEEEPGTLYGREGNDTLVSYQHGGIAGFTTVSMYSGPGKDLMIGHNNTTE
jgi:hypothetical protein